MILIKETSRFHSVLSDPLLLLYAANLSVETLR